MVAEPLYPFPVSISAADEGGAAEDPGNKRGEEEEVPGSRT